MRRSATAGLHSSPIRPAAVRIAENAWWARVQLCTQPVGIANRKPVFKRLRKVSYEKISFDCGVPGRSRDGRLGCTRHQALHQNYDDVGIVLPCSPCRLMNSFGGQGPLKRSRTPCEGSAPRNEARKRSRQPRGTSANQRCVLRSCRVRHSRTESAVIFFNLLSIAAMRPAASCRRLRYSRPLMGVARSACSSTAQLAVISYCTASPILSRASRYNA